MKERDIYDETACAGDGNESFEESGIVSKLDCMRNAEIKKGTAMARAKRRLEFTGERT